MGDTSSIQGVSTLGSTSSLARRPAIHRVCGSPKHRKEFQIPNLPGDAASIPRPQMNPHVQATTRQGDTVVTERGMIGSPPGSSPDTHFSVAAHKLPSPSRPPFTPLVPQLLQPLSPSTCTPKPVTTPRGHQRHQYPWLQNITVSLVIDQEGFRTVQPTFKRIGFLTRRLTETENTEVEVVTFVPTSRQVFRFHYAPFDGLPILRRLLVNNDENRDFLSRQAYLGLKSSGLYTVHGTEIPSSILGSLASPATTDNSEAAPACDPTRLYWQFDYSVEDRRAEQTGRILDGEKVLVPLTFTCSPRLLHPNQGKKIKFIQIVKKNVVPKLIAEKKPSPLIPAPRAPTMSLQTSAVPPWKTSVAQHATQLYFNESEAWNLHRRSQSIPREVPETSGPKRGHSTRHHHNMIDSRGSIPLPQHRRRASSAGESHIQPRRRGISPIRHILPPSRLRQLIEEGRGEQETESEPTPETGQTRLIHPPLDFFPLRPSPGFRY
jgi:hypothetical protein